MPVKNVSVNSFLSDLDKTVESGGYSIDEIEEACDNFFNKPTTGDVYHWRVVKSGSRWHLIEDHEANGTVARDLSFSARTIKEVNRMENGLAKLFHRGWGMTVNVTRERVTKKGVAFSIRTFCFPS